MRSYRYTVAEHDPDRPWIVIGDIRRLAVDLPEREDFDAWAAREWPRSRFTVQLEVTSAAAASPPAQAL